ncbi:MAG: metallophosphoesterase [Cyanobacteria bacterium J06614_10]
MKRRTFFFFGLGGLAIAARERYLFNVNKAKISQLKTGQSQAPSALQGEPLLRFIAIGDVGTGKRGQYAVARAMARYGQTSPFSLVLLAGDNIYDNGEIEKVEAAFERPYAQLLQSDVKFYAALGNHDVRIRQGEDEIVYPGYNMAGRYYSFSRHFAEGSIQFFALDTNQAYLDNLESWNAQLAWLQSELAISSADWKVAFAHHPVYSSGHHGSDESLIETLSPIFEQGSVQLYINGHDHNYERTVAINGTIYITSGNGAKLRREGRAEWTAYSASRLGFTLFEVYDTQLEIRAFDTRNRVYDQVSISNVAQRSPS